MKKIQVIDFYAEWCGPCKLISPIFNELKEEFKDDEDVQIIKYDVDSESQLAVEYKIKSIPTILFMKDGVVVERHIGAISKSVILSKIEDLKA